MDLEGFEVPVNSGRRGEDDFFHLVGAGIFEDLKGGEEIAAKVVEGILDGGDHGGLCGEVDDAVDGTCLGRQLVERRPQSIDDVDLMDGEKLVVFGKGEVFALACAEVVEHEHAAATREELRNDVGADKSGASCDDDDFLGWGL